MRKIWYCAAAGILIALGAAGLSACGKGEKKRDCYEIKAEYFAETRTLEAETTATVANPTASETDELKFQLWANAYREGAKAKPVSELFKHAYYDGASYGGVEIVSVEGAKSFEVCGEDENILCVHLGGGLEAGERVTLKFTYTVTLPKVNHRLGVSEKGVNLSHFYPELCAVKDGAFCERLYSSNGDPFVSEISDFDVTLTLPEDLQLICGFAAESITPPQEGKSAYHVRANGVRDVAFVLGKDYECASGEWEGIAVSYYYTDDASPEKTLQTALESLAFFSEKFGGYKYPSYAVVETGFVYGGMEFSALSMISSDLTPSEIPAVVAHETAHQWWYSMVGSDQYTCAWQDEGLAEYSAALFFEANPGYGIAYRDMIGDCERSYRAFFSVHSQTSGSADTTMERALTEFSGEYEYRSIAYDKGVILFDRVRGITGEKKFMNALKRYFEENCGTIATSEDLIVCFEKSGANVRAVFNSFLDGKCVI